MSDLERGLRELITDIVREEVRRALAEATQQDENLTTAEAAKFAKVAPGTIRRWIRGGRLTPHRAGRELRVSRRELQNLMRDGRCRDRELSPEEIGEALVGGEFT